MNQEAFADITARIRGNAFVPGGEGYDDARTVWNGTIDKKPGLIVKCHGVADVIAAVNFARAQGLGVSVRGGGHHVAGAAVLDGGMVIDLSGMRSARVDPVTRNVRAEGGALLLDVDKETHPLGLASPMGLFSETGIAGLTLAGGFGWMRRLYGLSCDALISADVVTADGNLVTASATENPDLFWSLRGGGWDMGVVTSLEYRTYPIDENMFFLFAAYPLEESREVIAHFNEFMQTAPRGSSPIAVLWTFPETEAYPEAIWNKDFVGIAGPHVGPPDEGQAILQPLRELGTSLFDGSDVVPFSVIQTLFDEEYPKGRRYYWKSTYLREMTPEAISVLADMGAKRPSPLTSLDLWPMGGAIPEVGPEETPVGHRDAAFLIGIESNWEDASQDAANIDWARTTQQLLEPYSTGGSYLNFEDLTEGSRFAASHGANFQRLQATKRRYDPDNLFRSRGLLA